MKRQAVLVEQKSNFEDLFVQLGKEIEIYEEIKE